ncbi:MAG: ATP-binding protein, partial [Myxococcota bacterium]|nr:ATP-binding protein [Myxococcota bacterium]
HSVIEMFNPAAEEMYKIPSADAVGRKLQDVIIPERFARDHVAGLENFIETGEGMIMGVKIETYSMRNDGSEFPVELTVQRLPDEESLRFIGYIRDLTERNRLREELGRQEKQVNLNRRLEAVGRLSGGVAHDFNNLLMAINGHADLLLFRDDVSDEIRSGLKEIAHAGDRAASITKQLLSFSRRDRLDSRNIQLNKVISLLNEMIRNILPTSIEIALELSDELWMVYTDEARLEQAILNLILNAADAQANGGEISIRTYNVEIDAAGAAGNKELTTGSYACVEVSDMGTGMDSHTMERIFDPFFTTKTLGEGTGLGLSTAHAIVRRSSGTILVESEEGAGSTFKILLPRAEETEVYYTEPKVPVRQKGGASGTILVVEDMDSVRRLVVRTLSQQGYRVLEAYDGERGYDLAIRHADEIDLIVTDVIMPRLGGVGMVARLRVSVPQLKVVYVSGHSQDQLDVTDVSDPRTEFLYKPFSLETLITVVERLLAS